MTAPDYADLDLMVRQAVDASARQRFAWLDRPTRDALGLVPSWTERLAAACQLAGPEQSLDELVDQLQELGVIQRTESIDADGRRTYRFWARDSVREPLLAQHEGAAGRRELRTALLRLGNSIERAARQGVHVPALVKAWAELAVAPTDEQRGTNLLRRTGEALGRDDTASALDWVRAGESIASVAGGALESVVLRCQRQVGLSYRRSHDAAYLEKFMERQEQVEAFDRLLEGPDDRWALHYIGMGGVGKTMLMRDISGKPGLAVGRVDFDHMDPRYPARRPGQLLAELTDELAPAAARSAEATELIAKVQERIVAFHETIGLRFERPTAETLASADFTRVVDAFAELLVALGGPVVLILDTCEELAKAQFYGETEAVQATFDILERIHSAVPSLRVVLAGRRLLASSGLGWECADAAPAWVRDMPDRPFLALHEMRAFDDGEVRAYFRDQVGLELSDRQIHQVEAESRETGRVVGLPTRIDEPRYNPFDVALYGDWFAEDPGLDLARAARNAGDPYVQARIIDRLQGQPAVVSALPGVVLLRTFDVERIRPEADEVGIEANELFDMLAQQEWTEYALRPSGPELRVEDGLLARILRHFERTAPGSLTEARARLAPWLDRLVRSTDVGELTVEHVDSSLRLLPESEAARLWRDIERRVVESGEWTWATTVTGRLLGEAALPLPGTKPAASPGVWAAVQATSLAADTVRRRRYQKRRHWKTVLERAADLADPDQRARVTAIARLGMLRAKVAGGAPPDATLVEALRSPPAVADELLAAARIAALEALVERGHAYEAEAAVDEQGPDAGFLLALKARSSCASGGAEAMESARQLFQVALRASPASRRPDRGHWLPPESPVDRIRLEWLLAEVAAASSYPPDGLLPEGAWLDEAVNREGTVDGDRLASALLHARLAREVVDPDVLTRIQDSPLWRWDEPPDLDEQPPTSLLATPPLFVSLGLAWAAAGHLAKAMAVIDEREGHYTERRSAGRLVQAAVEARLRIMTRVRMPGRGDQVRRAAAGADPRVVAAAWALGALTGTPPDATTVPDRTELLHGWWRAQLDWPAQMPLIVTRMEAAVRADAGQSDLSLDLVEISRRSAETGTQLPGRIGQLHPHRKGETSIPAMEADLRFHLRQDALSDYAPPNLSRRRDLAPRLAADMLLEEGALLARRLPVISARSLQAAYALYRETGDRLGAVLCSVSEVRAWLVAVRRGLVDPSRGRLFASMAIARYRPHYRKLARELPDIPPLRTAENRPTAAPEEWAGIARLISEVMSESREMFDVDVPDPAVEEEDQGPTRLRKFADAIIKVFFPARAEFPPLWYYKGLEILVGTAGVRPALHFRATTASTVRRKAWDALAGADTFASAASLSEVAVGRDPRSSRLIRWLRDAPARSRPLPVVVHGDGEEVHVERWEMLLNASEGASRYGMVTFEERFAVTRAYRPPEHRREPLGCRPPPGVAATAGETSITEAVLAGSAGGVLAAAAASVLAAWSGLWLVVVAAVLGAINGLISGYRRIYRWNRRSGWAAFVLDSTWGLVGTALALGVHLANLVVPSDYATACSYRQNRHVYFGGLALRRRYASTRGNVISNADSGRKAVRPSFLSRHEELHVWQSRIFGPLYQFVYAAWTVLGAVVGTALWIFTATERWRSVVETVAYYDNPFEYWAYVHDGRWPPAAANRRFRWPRPRESHGRRPARDAEVSVGCPPQWARQLGAAWEETRAPVEVLADRAFLTERSPSSNILHVVGQPVRTSAGWRLRLDDLESSGPADEAGAPQALFGPGVLREGVVDLVVLQRTPTLADIDFEASDGIREVAAALMAAGERHVVVIPPLPPRRAFDVANALGRWVPRSTTARTWRRLPDLVTSLRLRASRAYVDEATRRLVSPTDRRAGFDICLFSSDPTWVPRRLRPTRRETE